MDGLWVFFLLLLPENIISMVTIGQANETESSLGIVLSKSITLNIATETDSSLNIVVDHVLGCANYTYEEVRFIIEKTLVAADAQTINWKGGSLAATQIRLDADRIMLGNHPGLYPSGSDPIALYENMRFEFEQALFLGYYQAKNWDKDKSFYVDKAKRFSSQLMSVLYPSKAVRTNEPRGPSLEDQTLVEVWQVTPIIDIAGKTLNWTFVPLLPSQVSILFSHSAGVLTYLPSCTASVNIILTVESEMNLTENNADIIWSYENTYVGSNVDIIPAIKDTFAHSRSGVYLRSAQIAGIVRLDKDNTLKWDGASVGTGSSTIDLNSGFIVFDTTF